MTSVNKLMPMYFKYCLLLILFPSLTLPLFGQINLSLSADVFICEGGSVQLQIASLDGGDGNYTYFWSPSVGLSAPDISNPIASPTVSTLYTLTVQDGLGATASDVIEVIIAPTPNISITGDTEICEGTTTTLTASPGVAAYNWSIGATTSSITVDPTVTTTYSVTVTSFDGCETSEDITVVVNPSLNVEVESTDTNCGFSSGSATATVTNGVPPYQFLWGNGEGTPTIEFLPPGAYIVNVIDINGCSGQGVAEINVQGTPISSINIETVNTPCGTAEGSATVTVEGGEEPYTYLWDNGAITASITSIEPGNYRVTVTEASGCSAIGIAQVGEASPFINLGQTVVTNISCSGNNDGSIDLDVAGSNDYTYEWSNGDTTEDIANLAAGNYTVTVTGTNNCTSTETFIITEPLMLGLTATITDAGCNGEPTGSINLNVLNGTAPYSYLWSNGSTVEDLLNLPAGTYAVTVTDANGCTTEDAYTIDEPTLLQVDFDNSTVTDVDCGGTNGAIDISIIGGTAPYSYAWSNGENTEDPNSLTAGLYNVTITDANGCTVVANFEVNQITDLTVDAGIDQVICEGEEAVLNAMANGGEAPYTYSWSNGQTTASITIEPNVFGTYSVMVTDANGCTAEDMVTVSPSLAIDETIINSCEDTGTGSISLSVNGGTGSYTFTWSDIGSTGSDGIRTALLPGDYAVTITDGVCSTERAYNIMSIPTTPINITLTEPFCFGGSDGIITIDNPQADYLYEWNNGAIGTTITGVTAGIYCVTATNTVGCTNEACIDVSEPEQLNVAILGVPTEPCADNFTLEAFVTGGTAPYTFLWLSGDISFSTTANVDIIFPLEDISLTVTDANGCTVTEVITLPSAPEAIVTNEIAYLSCDNGLAVLDGTGSSTGPNIVYEWSSPGGFLSDQLVLETTAPGEYLLVVSYFHPALLCADTVSVTVVDLPNDFESGIDISLLGCNDYRLTGIRPANYDGPLAFEWTFPDATNSTEETIIPNQTGVYTLRATAVNLGCEHYSTVYIDLDAMDCFTIAGFVHAEEGETCLLDDNAPTLGNVQIIASGPSGSFSVFTDESGYYEMTVPIDVNTVEVISPSSSWLPCFETVSLGSPAAGSVTAASFWLQRIVSCPELSVNLTASLLRRCFTSLYCLSVCNEGTETAENPVVDLVLDPFLSLNNASITPVSVSGQVVSWELSSLPPGTCQTIYVWVDISCEAELGQTHCSEASASPSPLCSPADNWSGTNLELIGECENGEVIFTVSNTGDTDLSETVNYIVIEDAVAMMTQIALDDLGGDQEEAFSFPANGSTYTFQIEQVDNHPYTTYLSASVEGCGTNDAGSFSTGFATQYSQVTATPTTDVFCIDNVGAYDPNDKASLPVGYGEQHYIVPETELYYRIRFQNTGTDTAFTVVVRDELSELLDIRTLKPGNSSHNYELELVNERALTFTFNNILLPDSTTNLEASQGFVDFKIFPLADAPLESIIENNAAIYFDFNEPIVTNTVFHTLGRDFLEVVNVTVVPDVNINWEVYPNPVSDQLHLKLSGDLPTGMSLNLSDPKGQQLKTQAFAGTETHLSVSDLPSGIYFLQLIDTAQGRLLGTAKFIKK